MKKDLEKQIDIEENSYKVKQLKVATFLKKMEIRILEIRQNKLLWDCFGQPDPNLIKFPLNEINHHQCQSKELERCIVEWDVKGLKELKQRGVKIKDEIDFSMEELHRIIYKNDIIWIKVWTYYGYTPEYINEKFFDQDFEKMLLLNPLFLAIKYNRPMIFCFYFEQY